MLNECSICMRLYVYVYVNFGDVILLRGEECENSGKFEIYFRNTVNYCYSIGCKPENSLDLR